MPDSKAPLVYQANPINGEYLGQSYADPDPVDEGNWLIPGMAFTEAPPKVKKGFAAVHVPGGEQTWSVLQDFRGLVYRIDSGQAVAWDRFGPLPEGLTPDPRPSPHYVWVDSQWKLDVAAESDALRLQAYNTRDGYLRESAIRIAPLQYAVDLGEASSDEEKELKAWKKYSVDLNRVHLQSGFPTTIDWPAVPNFPQT